MTDPTDRGTTATLRRRFRSIEAAALVGIAFAILALVASALLAAQPGGAGTQEELAAWYGDAANRRLVLVGLVLTILAAVMFLWFIAVIRRRVGQREDQFFATVFLGCGILLTAILLVGATAASSVAVGLELGGGDVPAGGALVLVDGFASGLLLLVLPRIQAVFILATSTVGLRTGAFPRWLAVGGYVIALGMFVVPLVLDPIVAVFPIWVGAVSGVLLSRARRIGRQRS